MITKTLRKIIKIDEEKCNGCGLCKGFPKEADFKVLDSLAAAIAEKHKEHGFIQ